MQITYLIPILVWPVGPQVESASRYWWLTQKNGNELESGVGGSQGRRKAGSVQRFGGVPGMEAVRVTVVSYRAGDENLQQETGKRVKIAFLIPGLAWPLVLPFYN